MSDDAEPSHPESLHIEASYEGAEITVTIAGSLDLNSSERLRASVDETLSARPQWIAIDAGAVTFVDSSGLAALLRARHLVTEAGVGFRFTAASPALRRVAELAGFQTLLPDE
jgi:anti-sigma B factor antagonist